jgi:hypothetical protein
MSFSCAARALRTIDARCRAPSRSNSSANTRQRQHDRPGVERPFTGLDSTGLILHTSIDLINGQRRPAGKNNTYRGSQ